MQLPCNRSRTFPRNKLGAGHFGAGQTRRRSNSAQVKLGAGQTRRRSNSAQVKLGAGQTRRRSNSAQVKLGAGQTRRRSNSAQVKLGAGQTRRRSNLAQKKYESTLLYSCELEIKMVRKVWRSMVTRYVWSMIAFLRCHYAYLSIILTRLKSQFCALL